MTRIPWREFWLPPSGPVTLAAVRIIVAVQALWMLLSRDAVGSSAMPSVVWQGVSRERQLRYLLVQGMPGIEFALWCLAVASLACVLIGYRTRIFGVIAALLLYHLAPLQSLLDVIAPWGRGLTIATLALPILACAPCEDRWSVGNVRQRAPVREPQAYGWAVMLVRLLFAQIYLFSAIGRLENVGWKWASTETVRNHLLVFGLAVPSLDTPLNAWLVSHPTLCAVLAACTLIFELVFVVAVFVPVTRLPLALAGVTLHVSLWLTLGFRFPNLPHFLLFIDFNGEGRAGRTFSGRRDRAPAIEAGVGAGAEPAGLQSSAQRIKRGLI